MARYRQVLGDYGEALAKKYCLAAGMKILAQNYKVRGGEIDIIAKDVDTIVFMEVKTRKSTKFGTPAEAIDYKKQQALYRTAERYLYENGLHENKARFDALLLSFTEEEKLSLKHIKNIEITAE